MKMGSDSWLCHMWPTVYHVLNETGTNSGNIELKFTLVTFKCKKLTGRPGIAPVSLQPRTGGIVLSSPAQLLVIKRSGASCRDPNLRQHKERCWYFSTMWHTAPSPSAPANTAHGQIWRRARAGVRVRILFASFRVIWRLKTTLAQAADDNSWAAA